MGKTKIYNEIICTKSFQYQINCCVLRGFLHRFDFEIKIKLTFECGKPQIKLDLLPFNVIH